METLVIFRDRQELQAVDLNSIGGFADTALAHIVSDAITAERLFVGLGVTQHSATEIDVAAGRLWDGVTGKRFAKNEAETISLFSYLPLVDQKYLVVSVIGQDVDTTQEPRDFLVDLSSGQTEPRAVLMHTARQVAILITAGLESTTPQRPDAPTGYTPIAHVLLDASGIQAIELAENRQLMRLWDVWQQTLANLAWINEATPKLASIMSDLASLAVLARSSQTTGLVTQLAAEVAVLRDKLQLPATYTEYEADLFFDASESDAANPDYHALCRLGLRFPWAGETEQQLALANPLATTVKNCNGLILPAYTEVARLTTSGYAGELLLSQYQYQNVTTRQCTRTKQRIEYSPTRQYWTSGLYGGVVDNGSVVETVFEGELPAGVTLGDSSYTESWTAGSALFWNLIRERDVTIHTWQETYTVVDSQTESVNGAITAQTFLNSQGGWLSKIGLTFTKKAADGAVTMYLMDTVNGLPNHNRVLGKATVAAAAIKIKPSETFFSFTEPVFLAAGRRYAIVLVTAGAHGVAVVEGSTYGAGTLFYSTDGEYFQGDFQKDLMMSLYYAKFANPRTVVDLSPIDLSGGIAALSVLAECVQPDATSLTYEYKPSGASAWTPLTAGTADNLLGLPALVYLRAVFNGSQDLMPGLGLSGSKLRAQRPATSFRHISSLRTLATAKSEIHVILRLESWDATRHTCDVALLSGGNAYTGAVTDEHLDAETIRRTVVFSLDPGIAEYKIRIDGTTTTSMRCYSVAQRMDVAI